MSLHICSRLCQIPFDFHGFIVCTNVYLSSIDQFNGTPARTQQLNLQPPPELTCSLPPAPEIVRTYADEGKSGLSLDGRASLQKLIVDFATGVADFTLVSANQAIRRGRRQLPWPPGDN